jgi:hypothetical protein
VANGTEGISNSPLATLTKVPLSFKTVFV